ncbi:hypothetical protein TNCV_1611061 [Trichonephila clavipes]|nr:hypothetical protein TNCV_1611061 [Trichonephila clavipes]
MVHAWFSCGIRKTARISTHQQGCRPHTADGWTTEHCKYPGISWISQATKAIIAIRASSESTVLAYRRLSIWFQRKKCRRERSGGRIGQFTGSPRPNPFPRYAVSSGAHKGGSRDPDHPKAPDFFPIDYNFKYIMRRN